MIPMLNLTRQYASLRREIDAAIHGVLESGHFIDGPNVKAFETELAAYSGAAHAVALNSGTDALSLALRALDIGPGDEVVTTPFTFVATAEAITLCGATPVFADVDPQTLNIDPDAIAAAITPRTRVIIPVHLYGLPAEMDVIMRIAQACDIAVVEDCAQALGARIGDRRAGTVGTIGAVSFFPSKNLGAYGDGGALLTNDAGIAQRVRRLRTHGSLKKYHHVEPGINSRLDEIQAAILRIKLPHLDEWIEQRQAIATAYRRGLEGLAETTLPAESPQHTYHQFTIRVRDRDSIAKRLGQRGIASAVHYPVPVHLQQAYAQMRAGPFPNAERAAEDVLSLPMFPELEVAEIAMVVMALCEAQSAARDDVAACAS